MNIKKSEEKLTLGGLKIDRSGLKKFRRKTALRFIAYALLTIAISMGIYWGIRKYVTGRISVKVASPRIVEKDEGLIVLNANGYIEASRIATVSSKITGRVDQIYVNEGDHVTKGSILAELDNSDFQSEMKLAEQKLVVSEKAISETEVRLSQAKRDFERSEKLYNENFISLDNLEHAKTEYESLQASLKTQQQEIELAKSSVNLTKTNLENTVVKAPFDGIVISKDAMEGEMVSPITAGAGFTRTGIVTIVNMDALYIEADINESYLERIKENQEVRIILEAYENQRYKGFVQKIIPAINRQKATIKVKIAFVDRDSKVLPDMAVKLEFLKIDAGEEGSKRKVLVKRDAVWEKDGENFVFVINDDKAKKIPVTIGEDLGGEIEILQGLNGDETIIVSAPYNLEDGSLVSISQ